MKLFGYGETVVIYLQEWEDVYGHRYYEQGDEWCICYVLSEAWDTFDLYPVIGGGYR